ncbi:MAG: TonB-dependent receptor [Flavobacteriales bacterium]|nr:TonB-dependent receptor [Flavobacteriales bacterium]
MNYMYQTILLLFVANTMVALQATGQQANLFGHVTSDGQPVEFAIVSIDRNQKAVLTDSLGYYRFSDLGAGQHEIEVQAIGYNLFETTLPLSPEEKKELEIVLIKSDVLTEEVVISGTMQEISRMDCPVAVEVYSSQFFKSNPTSSVFEAMQNINGVKPQINCNVCNTGDIHINGLEGPYTMVLIDGMPVVSGLSTVYGLSGIPSSLIERVEIVKGPASTLYGSEAVGGLINIITKKNENAHRFSADIMTTSWAEVNADLSTKYHIGKNIHVLTGVNYFNYSVPQDHNQDGFTDVTLQDRISVFSKIQIRRKLDRQWQIAGRYVYEDRWGGDMRWQPQFRGGDSIYGESIYTSRWEFYGTYDLPFAEKITFQCSANGHQQNSYYGQLSFQARQEVLFGQLLWPKDLGHHAFLSGLSVRYTHYDDNTPATSATATSDAESRAYQRVVLPGIFVQDDVKFNDQHRLSTGCRYDYHTLHGHILSPRINYKWNTANRKNTVRAGIGNGYRVANVFTEDHAALTGSRKVEFVDQLKPETSWNYNIHFSRKIFQSENSNITFECSGYYTRFGNRIIADYLTDPNKIIYANLQGKAISRGITANVSLFLRQRWTVYLGINVQDVYRESHGQRQEQLFTEKYSGMWDIRYKIKHWSMDYNGKLYSPMKLPLISAHDPRQASSPWWNIQNIQFTYSGFSHFEIYCGVKNLLNWTPARNNPFLIARSFDPIDKQVTFDQNGQAIQTAYNPYALTFDPTYVYAPNQGIRFFLGIRYHFI